MASQLVAIKFLVVAACSVLTVNASQSLVRTEGSRQSVVIDQHSQIDVEKRPGSDPCSYLGCNSHKCEWASGGRITRLVAKKACSNAVMVGSGDGTSAVVGPPTASSSLLGKSSDGPASAETPSLQTVAIDAASSQATPALQTVAIDAASSHATTMAKVVTLKDCMNAVRASSKTGSTCSGHFQLHKDTLACMCVPAGQACAETEDENVCRYQIVEPK